MDNLKGQRKNHISNCTNVKRNHSKRELGDTKHIDAIFVVYTKKAFLWFNKKYLWLSYCFLVWTLSCLRFGCRPRKQKIDCVPPGFKMTSREPDSWPASVHGERTGERWRGGDSWVTVYWSKDYAVLWLVTQTARIGIESQRDDNDSSSKPMSRCWFDFCFKEMKERKYERVVCNIFFMGRTPEPLSHVCKQPPAQWYACWWPATLFQTLQNGWLPRM